MDPVESALPTILNARDDAVATAALTVVRRPLIEGVSVTRDGLAQEAFFALSASAEDAPRPFHHRGESPTHLRSARARTHDDSILRNRRPMKRAPTATVSKEA
jgi:hypothetical protein